MHSSKFRMGIAKAQSTPKGKNGRAGTVVEQPWPLIGRRTPQGSARHRAALTGP